MCAQVQLPENLKFNLKTIQERLACVPNLVAVFDGPAAIAFGLEGGELVSYTVMQDGSPALETAIAIEDWLIDETDMALVARSLEEWQGKVAWWLPA